MMASHFQLYGMVERLYTTLESLLFIFLEKHQQDWDNYVPLILLAYLPVEAELNFLNYIITIGFKSRSLQHICYFWQIYGQLSNK